MADRKKRTSRTTRNRHGRAGQTRISGGAPPNGDPPDSPEYLIRRLFAEVQLGHCEEAGISIPATRIPFSAAMMNPESSGIALEVPAERWEEFVMASWTTNGAATLKVFDQNRELMWQGSDITRFLSTRANANEEN